MSKHSKKNEDNSNIQVYFNAITNSINALRKAKPDKFETKDSAEEFLIDLITKSSLETKIKDLFEDKDFDFPKHSFKMDTIAESRYSISEIEFLDSMFGFCAVSELISQDKNMKSVPPIEMCQTVLLYRPGLLKKLYK